MSVNIYERFAAGQPVAWLVFLTASDRFHRPDCTRCSSSNSITADLLRWLIGHLSTACVHDWIFHQRTV